MTTERTPSTEAGRAMLVQWKASRTHPPSAARERDMVDWVMRFEAEARAPLLAAAQRVITEAETDDNWDGEYIAFLVPADVFEALRAALREDPS